MSLKKLHNICSKEICCGCTACVSICKNKALTMDIDDEGFLSPFIDEQLCNHCNKCKQVCPMISNHKNNTQNYVYATWIKNQLIRRNSSSGGVFFELASYFIKNNGYVSGAIIKEFYVRHIITNNFKDLELMQSSKYVQSDISGIYQSIFNILTKGNRVLFVGTPCQVAGLKNFLKKDFMNLYTIDLICHGVPSPGVFQKYIYELKEEFYTAYTCKFRDKQDGWNSNYAFSLIDRNGNVLHRENGLFNVYIRGFLTNVFNRNSCQTCPFATKERVGDITLGDFWNIGAFEKDLDDKKGTSLVFVNTKKGNDLLKSIKDQLYIEKKISLDIASSAQENLRKPSKASPYRSSFFEYYKKSDKIIQFLENKLYKVGILNFHFANNYGAVLIPFALSKTLEKLGFRPEIINYFGEVPRLDDNFESFRKKYLVRSASLYSKKDLVGISPWWKRIIVGSDQIWRMFDTGIYMLNWAYGKKNFISYGASFGYNDYVGRITKEEARILLKRFDAISVREDSGVTICEKFFGIPAIQVLDPTFLLDEKDYLELINTAKLNQTCFSDYIACVFLNKGADKYIQNNPKINKYKIIDALFDNNSFRKVEEWLNIIYNAKYVITDSFHGTVFSIIFKKQFVSIVANSFNGIARIPSLLKTLKIPLTRVYKSVDEISEDSFKEQINYSLVENALEFEKKISISFLKTALNKPIEVKNQFYKIGL